MCAGILAPHIPNCTPFVGITSAAAASGAPYKTGLPLPRFVSISASEARMRIGPERRFRSSWLFVRKHYPIEIIDEHRYWRKVKDVDGTTGWMHKTLLSGRRTALTLPPRTPLYKEITPDMPVVAIITANNIVFLEDCRSQSGYCSVQIKDYTGWIAKSALWGLNADEQK